MKTLSAVIVAAGSSSRMGTDKQQILLCSKPVWMHAVITFAALPQTAEIVVVTRAENIPLMQKQLYDYAAGNAAIQKTSFVQGGATRTDSVSCGIAACSQQTDYFAIHDGARPLVTAQDIGKALLALNEHPAVSLGVYVKDTIKVVDAGGKVLSTPDRSALMITQTPQIFEREIYLKALAAAKEKGLSPTDDCQLLESYGVPVYMVTGSYQNIKITTPEDLKTAEAFLTGN